MASIELDDVKMKLFHNVSPVTLEKQHKMKEVSFCLQSARIHHRWEYPFLLLLPHNGTTYTSSLVAEEKETFWTLGLLDKHCYDCLLHSRPSPTVHGPLHHLVKTIGLL